MGRLLSMQPWQALQRGCGEMKTVLECFQETCVASSTCWKSVVKKSSTIRTLQCIGLKYSTPSCRPCVGLPGSIPALLGNIKRPARSCPVAVAAYFLTCGSFLALFSTQMHTHVSNHDLRMCAKAEDASSRHGRTALAKADSKLCTGASFSSVLDEAAWSDSPDIAAPWRHKTQVAPRSAQTLRHCTLRPVLLFRRCCWRSGPHGMVSFLQHGLGWYIGVI